MLICVATLRGNFCKTFRGMFRLQRCIIQRNHRLGSIVLSRCLSPTVLSNAGQRHIFPIHSRMVSSTIKSLADKPPTPLRPSESPPVTAVTAESTAEKKSLTRKIKEVASHYWDGSRLLWTQMKISARLVGKLLKGTKLTRREYRQLQRTSADMIRLVPFLVFVIVPFMEFLLPFFLTVFPNMLPSTFESKNAAIEKKNKLLKLRLEMARFLQETVAEVAAAGSDKSEATQEFVDYFRKIRNTGELATTEDLLRIARKFKDELTLDNLSRPQLVSMGKYMNINAFGTDNMLRHQIKKKLDSLLKDDKMIMDEGVESLSLSELQNAASSRGIRTVGISPTRLRHELQQWIDLHMKHEIPGVLLILSRAFQLTDKTPDEKQAVEALHATLSSLPDSVVNEAVLQMSEKEGTATNKQRLNVLEQQEEMIADELEQEEAEKLAHLRDTELKKAALPDQQSDEVAVQPAEDVAKEEVKVSDEEIKEFSEVLAVLGSKDPEKKAKELFKLDRAPSATPQLANEGDASLPSQKQPKV